MKRLIVSFALAVAAAVPLAASTPVAAQGRWDREEHWGRREERWERRDERWDNRGGWDRSRHNGYYHNNRWHYGPPPRAYSGSPDYRPGYTAWRRGALLPPTYRSYVIEDYTRYRLRPPPRGYDWYRVGDDFMLAGQNGMIFEIVPFD
jgi:Ni/Co efflux regulator RcnB